MGIREDMEQMMQGNYSKSVMTEEEKKSYEDAPSGSEKETKDEETKTEKVTPNETADEIAGGTKNEEVKTESKDTGEDTKAEQEVVVKTEPDGEEVALNQENVDATAESKAGDAQLDEKTTKTSSDQTNEAESQTKEVDYKQRYEELMKEHEPIKAFRDKVTADFKANGKTVKGIDDADKIVKNLQMSTGLTGKLSEYKKAKQFIDPMQARGLMQNPEKFDVLMKMADGDVGAMKQFLKERGVDPVDLDIEEDFKYEPSSTRASQEEMAFNDMQETADSYGVSEKFTSTVLSEWDPDSAGKLFNGDDGRRMASRLAEQMSNGIYDKVSAISENMKITQPGFSGLSSLDQYNKASEIYNNEISSKNKKAQAKEIKAPVAEQQKAMKTEAEIRAEIETRVRAEIKTESDTAKMNAENAALAEQRDKAASLSQNRAAANATTGSKEPQTLSEKRAEWNKMIRM